MIHLTHSFLLLVGGLLLLPYLLRPQRAWHYSSLEMETKELYALFALPGLVLLLLSTALKQTWALEI
jgi:hypothetical protein